MKVAIVTCGLLDCILPLVKYLTPRVSVDLYLSVYGNQFTESVGSFDIQSLPLGLSEEEVTRRIMGDTLYNYTQELGPLRIKIFKYPSLKVFNRRNLSLHRQFAAAINQENYDVVHLNGYRGSQMFLYAYLRNVGRVWTIHDPILHSGEDKWQTRLGYSLYRFFKAHFILHNQKQLPIFSQKYGINAGRCHYVPLGPYEVFTLFANEQAPATEPHTVLFYGRISPYKGVEYLVEAARKVRQQLPSLRVIIAGKPNYDLDTQAIEQDDTFEFHNGYVPNDRLAHLIQRAALVVCPYVDATQSGVVMTAYAFGKPVVATTVGGLPEMVEEGVTGRLVPPRDADALADTLLTLLENTDQVSRMQNNLRNNERTEALSWESIAQATRRVYEQAQRDR